MAGGGHCLRTNMPNMPKDDQDAPYTTLGALSIFAVGRASSYAASVIRGVCWVIRGCVLVLLPAGAFFVCAKRGENTMNVCSTERVRRYRERQEEAGRKRIMLYLDPGTQRKLDQLAGDKAQARYLEALVKGAVNREWNALENRQKDDLRRQTVRNGRAVFLGGRRRSLAEGK